MTFDAEAVYTELHEHFRERVRRNEPLARHGTFGVGGPADVWVSLDAQDELIGLVRMCVERYWPLLLVGNGTNVLYAGAGVRGIVARVALNNYTIEDLGDGTAQLAPFIERAGSSWLGRTGIWPGHSWYPGWWRDQQCRCPHREPGAGTGVGRRVGCS